MPTSKRWWAVRDVSWGSRTSYEVRDEQGEVIGAYYQRPGGRHWVASLPGIGVAVADADAAERLLLMVQTVVRSGGDMGAAIAALQALKEQQP